MNRKLYVVCAAAGLFVMGCLNPKSSNEVSQAKALERAKHELAKMGIPAELFKVTLGHEKEPVAWSFVFESAEKYPPPGSTHVVRVDKNSGKATVLLGD